MDFFEFIIDDLPLGINDALEIINIVDSDFSVLFLRFKFEFDFQDDDFWIGKTFRLLFETSIWESFFKSYSTNQKRIIDWSTRYLFNTDQIFVK